MFIGICSPLADPLARLAKVRLFPVGLPVRRFP